MPSFEYSTPTTVDQAIALLNQSGASALAGGTDLLIHLRAGIVAPKQLVDLSALDLNYVRKDDGIIRIGAMTTFAEILDSDVVRRDLPCLAESAAEIGAVQTRNMATLGGNLCSAVPSADSAPPLLVYDARVKIAGSDGERLVPLEQFFVGPKKNALKPGELLIEIQASVPLPRTGARFLKLGRRKAMSLAVVNVAARLTLGQDHRRVENVRIALGAVAPTPRRAKRAESVLQGSDVYESLIDRAARAAADEIAPISDLRATATFRRESSRVLVKRALTHAWQMATGETKPND